MCVCAANSSFKYTHVQSYHPQELTVSSERSFLSLEMLVWQNGNPRFAKRNLSQAALKCSCVTVLWCDIAG